MKLNLKRAVVGLTMAVCLFSLSACSAKPVPKYRKHRCRYERRSLSRFPSPRILELYTGLEDSQMAEFR